MCLKKGFSIGVQPQMRPLLISTTLLVVSGGVLEVREGVRHVKRKVLASSHAVSVAWRFTTRMAKRTVVTTQLLGRDESRCLCSSVLIGGLHDTTHEHQTQPEFLSSG